MSDETTEGHAGFPCSSCGAQLSFSPGQAQLTCPYCGHEQAVEDPQSQNDIVIQEYDYLAALDNPSLTKANEVLAEAKEIECQNCGAITLFVGQAGRCPFCDSPMVIKESSEGLILPESLLPFAVESTKAQQLFRDWIKSRWFAPNDLVKRSQKEGIDGVYLPYWTYDSETASHYRGERGEHYYEEEEYTDADGEHHTRRVQKTRWYSVRGNVANRFDDVMVCASKSLPQKLFDALEPWPVEELRPYNEGYLAGFVAEKYGIVLRDGFSLAEKKMDEIIRRMIKQDIGGDNQRIHSVDTQHTDIKFKLILLPLWISSFRYNDTVYRFIINARTGKASGERPYSAIKIALLVIVVLGIVGFLFTR
ncbi:MAG: hypothetical protein VX278_22025 [Myxococcota bacterium]|nr:hypothetical protein [Myxococcota bacterium]